MEKMRMDTELPNKMACLDILDSQMTEVEDSFEEGSRPLRPRRAITTAGSSTSITNRRVILKPKKRQQAPTQSPEAYYTDRTVKTTFKSLETIFEEPKTLNDTTLLIGMRKIKRSLTFPDGPKQCKDKIKKRRSKIKRLLGNKNFANRKKLSMQAFLKKLHCLDSDENTSLDTDKASTDKSL